MFDSKYTLENPKLKFTKITKEYNNHISIKISNSSPINQNDLLPTEFNKTWIHKRK